MRKVERFLEKGESVAVFGYNNIAQKHFEGLCRILGEDMSEKLVIAGRDVEKAQLMTEKYGKLEVYPRWETLLEQKKPKLVVVATPNFLHKDMTIRALQAGAHVLCEKPLGVNAHEVREMYEAARDCGRFLIPAMSTRYSENALWLKEQVGGLSGWDFREGSAKYLRARHIPGSVGFLAKDKAGGGALLDLGVHVLDLALWIWNKPVASVTGKTKTDKTELVEDQAHIKNDYGQTIDTSNMDVEYEAEAEIIFADGGKLNLHVSWASLHKDAVRGREADEVAPYVHLKTNDGRALEWSVRQGKLVVADSPSHNLENTSREERQVRYSRQIEHAARVVTGEERPMIREEEMIRLHEIIDAIYLSATEGGRRVTFDKPV